MKNSAAGVDVLTMKVRYVSLTDAKAELQRLIAKARKGELILICHYGRPKAWIEPLGTDYKEVRKRLRLAVRMLQQPTERR
jgi:prevent-host-death family protein